MRINNTQNSQNFGTRYAILDTKGTSMMDTLRQAGSVKRAINEGCAKLNVPVKYAGDMAGSCLKMAFVTEDADIKLLEKSGMDEIAFVKTDKPIILELIDVYNAIRKGRFDFLNGKILE